MNQKKHGRGDRREGAGRPRSENPSKLYTFRVGGKIAECLDAQKNRTDFIKNAIEMAMVVWGIGRRTLETLNYYGIHTPLEFAEKSESWVRSHFKKPGQQTWLELNGIPCIDTTEVKRNQNICTSRSFGGHFGDNKCGSTLSRSHLCARNNVQAYRSDGW